MQTLMSEGFLKTKEGIYLKSASSSFWGAQTPAARSDFPGRTKDRVLVLHTA